MICFLFWNRERRNGKNRSNSIRYFLSVLCRCGPDCALGTRDNEQNRLFVGVAVLIWQYRILLLLKPFISFITRQSWTFNQKKKMCIWWWSSRTKMNFCTFFLAPKKSVKNRTKRDSLFLLRSYLGTWLEQLFAEFFCSNMCLDASTVDDDDPVITLGVSLLHAFSRLQSFANGSKNIINSGFRILFVFERMIFVRVFSLFQVLQFYLLFVFFSSMFFALPLFLDDFFFADSVWRPVISIRSSSSMSNVIRTRTHATISAGIDDTCKPFAT